jgi:hypothetical protein
VHNPDKADLFHDIYLFQLQKEIHPYNKLSKHF